MNISTVPLIDNTTNKLKYIMMETSENIVIYKDDDHNYRTFPPGKERDINKNSIQLMDTDITPIDVDSIVIDDIGQFIDELI